MLYVVKYRYVDDKGEEKVLFDGFDHSKGESFGVSNMSDPCICAYTTKSPAIHVKCDLDDTLENMHRVKMAKKIWKAKVVAVPGSSILDGRTQKATDNAAFRYYYSFCI